MVRYYGEDLAYIDRLAREIGIPPGALLRGAARQFLSGWCKWHGDQVPAFSVPVR
jgi:hypothetical protein